MAQTRLFNLRFVLSAVLYPVLKYNIFPDHIRLVAERSVSVHTYCSEMSV